MQSDNPINPQAWYFRLADVLAPCLVAAGGLVAIAASINLYHLF